MSKNHVFVFEHNADVLIVTPQGSFMEFRDDDVRNSYNEAYRLLFQPGARHLLIDFSNLDYFGSTFVGIILNLAKAARKNNGETALCHLSDNMRDMLKTLMLLENRKINFSMTPYPDREAALAKLAEFSKIADAAP
ncbi:MAG TPA: STAS domain-containing protein [Planctomycetaceae bacterium]|nr:STAS domain-containing protein [Planctomycetaceae bacterium]